MKNSAFQLRLQAICILAVLLKKKLFNKYQNKAVQGSQNIDGETIKQRLTQKGGVPALKHAAVSKKCYRISIQQKELIQFLANFGRTSCFCALLFQALFTLKRKRHLLTYIQYGFFRLRRSARVDCGLMQCEMQHEERGDRWRSSGRSTCHTDGKRTKTGSVLQQRKEHNFLNRTSSTKPYFLLCILSPVLISSITFI